MLTNKKLYQHFIYVYQRIVNCYLPCINYTIHSYSISDTSKNNEEQLSYTNTINKSVR